VAEQPPTNLALVREMGERSLAGIEDLRWPFIPGQKIGARLYEELLSIAVLAQPRGKHRSRGAGASYDRVERRVHSRATIQRTGVA
jgi:hypothetical protein